MFSSAPPTWPHVCVNLTIPFLPCADPAIMSALYESFTLQHGKVVFELIAQFFISVRIRIEDFYGLGGLSCREYAKFLSETGGTIAFFG